MRCRVGRRPALRSRSRTCAKGQPGRGWAAVRKSGPASTMAFILSEAADVPLGIEPIPIRSTGLNRVLGSRYGLPRLNDRPAGRPACSGRSEAGLALPSCGASDGGARSPCLKLLGLIGVGLPGHRAVRLTVDRAGVLSGQLLVQDRAYGVGAAPALWAATEIAVDLGGGAGAVRTRAKARTYLAVREDVARADDHRSPLG